ncbi:MAG: hypothetical protein HLUCCX14_02685 [Marinobacter excellens HL-55]|uniref:Uncharacterized protein n=1 Tax=Marinobacter excellens HL-55 TaxID=1305731 RepID=A0A0P7Z666_9GAMM|nr:MAG: hypothetical protein HLUCCX14_02685 [Marinobacter excellens HL-55]
MEPTAKVAITNMLNAIIDSRVSTDSRVILGSVPERPASSASIAMKVPPTDNTQITNGLIHSRSLIRLKKNRSLSEVKTVTSSFRPPGHVLPCAR